MKLKWLEWHNITYDPSCSGNELYCHSPKDHSVDWLLEVHVLFPPYNEVHFNKNYLSRLKSSMGKNYDA